MQVKRAPVLGAGSVAMVRGDVITWAALFTCRVRQAGAHGSAVLGSQLSGGMEFDPHASALFLEYK